jgi:hypothetical protein
MIASYKKAKDKQLQRCLFAVDGLAAVYISIQQR